jgi:hypothetical protein
MRKMSLLQWLSQTIVHRLAKEIICVNEDLRKLGCEDMEIGGEYFFSVKYKVWVKKFHFFCIIGRNCGGSSGCVGIYYAQLIMTY